MCPICPCPCPCLKQCFVMLPSVLVSFSKSSGRILPWVQFGIVTPFALAPQPSVDSSGAKLGKGLKGAKSADELMGAKSGNSPTNFSCESLRAWASQPCICHDARLHGLDLGSSGHLGSSGSGQEQPEMVSQKASTEVAMKRQEYHTVLSTYLGDPEMYVCCNHTCSQVQVAGQGFLQLPSLSFLWP